MNDSALVLVRLSPEYCHTLASLLADGQISRTTALVPYPYTLDHAEAFVARAAVDGEGAVVRGITVGHRLVGVCSARRQAHGAWNVAYWVGVDFQGRGYATEALRQLMTRLDGVSPRRYVGSHLPGNAASAKVLLHNGFRVTGCSPLTVRDETVMVVDYARP